MALVVKQDSNFTDLRYAVEQSAGVLPNSPVWLPLEPNSYKTFGGNVKTKARMPINSSRQLKKGVVVDLDADAGFQTDLTASNFQDLAQCFLYAALRTKSELAVANVDGTANGYSPASGGDTYWAGDLLFGKVFDDAANNGLKRVTGFPVPGTVLVTDTGILTASTQTGIISRVGYQFGAGEVTVEVSGSLPKLVIGATVAASGTLTNDGTVVSNGDTVTIGGKVYTFQTTLTNVDGNVHIAAGDNVATMTNLFHAINASGGTAGTDYATATVASARVTATNPTGTTVVVTAKAAGAQGNSITTTESSTHLVWTSGATLSGGSGARALNSFGIIPGEMLYVGGDGAAEAFFHAVDNGFVRVRSVTATYIELDKTQNIMVTDDGTVNGAGGAGQTIRLFFGRVCKNESDPTLIIKRTIQLERTLGYTDDTLPSQIQAEYILAALANDVKIDLKTADIVRMEMDFLGTKNELRPGSTGVKSGTRPGIIETDAFNSTSDVAYSKMAIVTAGNPCPSPLFAFFTDLIIDVKNNVKMNKAVGRLGAFSSTAGFFQVMASLTAYFTDVAEMQAVQDNKSITVETHLVKFNAGVSIDLPLVVLSKAIADVKLNEPIHIPLASEAATAKLIAPALDYTMLMVFWDYLPTLAG